MTLGEVLRKARLDHCMTQRELSEKVGVSSQVICYHENDKKTPGWKTLRKYCEELGLDLSEMAKLKYEEKKDQDRDG